MLPIKGYLLLIIGLVMAITCRAQMDGGSGTQEDPYRVSTLDHLQHIRTQIKGEGGYTAFRSPAMVVTQKGTILAFTEGRKTTWRDDGAMDDIIVKRSEDGGKTWGPIIIAAEDGINSCKNATPVVLSSGRIILVYTWTAYIEESSQREKRQVHMTYSDDDGVSWSTPRDITRMVYKEEWDWYGTGPGHGIVKHKDPHKGRIIIPARHNIRGEQAMASHMIYSDDQGETWHIGGIALRHPKRSNESMAVELSNGDIMLNCRTTTPGEIHRVVAISSDGGESIDTLYLDRALIEPPAQGSILRHSLNRETGKYNILFSNPESSEQGVRVHGTIKLSEDDGKTWTKKYQYSGPSPVFSGYSDIAVINENGEVGVLYETGRHYASPLRWDGIVCKTVSFDDIDEPITTKNPPPIDENEVEAFQRNLNFVFDSRDGHYVQTADIDAGETKNWNEGKGFTPIGDRHDTFTGYYDGNGYAIKNLTINRKDRDRVGLFGFAGIGHIKNVTLKNVAVSAEHNNTGTIVGYLWRGTVKKSRADGKVCGDHRVGGLVGFNRDGRIIKSNFAGEITGNRRVGGLVGENRDSGIIINSEADSKIYVNTGNDH